MKGAVAHVAGFTAGVRALGVVALCCCLAVAMAVAVCVWLCVLRCVCVCVAVCVCVWLCVCVCGDVCGCVCACVRGFVGICAGVHVNLVARGSWDVADASVSHRLIVSSFPPGSLRTVATHLAVRSGS